MTIRELIEHLSTMPPDTKIAVFGHFGEPFPMSKSDFRFHDYKGGESPQGITGPYLQVTAIDIGPEPD